MLAEALGCQLGAIHSFAVGLSSVWALMKIDAVFDLDQTLALLAISGVDCMAIFLLHMLRSVSHGRYSGAIISMQRVH